MKKTKDIKKILIFIFFPLMLFIVPFYYWINDNITNDSFLDNNSSFVIGKVSTSSFNGFRNIVKYDYVFEDKTYETKKYEFNGDKPLPIGLPIIIQINKNKPTIHRLLKDSLVSYDSGFVKYHKSFNGGWTYELIPAN